MFQNVSTVLGSIVDLIAESKLFIGRMNTHVLSIVVTRLSEV